MDFIHAVSFCPMCQPNNVWRGLKHLGTHDSSEFVPFAAFPFVCFLMVGTIMSPHAGFVVARFVARGALECCLELLL